MEPYPFDPSYGYTPNTLLEVESPPPPADFEAFWSNTNQETHRIDLNLQTRQIPSPKEEFKLFEVEYDSLDEVRIGGWLVVPSTDSPTCGAIIGHGYGGREFPDFNLPFTQTAMLFPCARGFHRSAHGGFPAIAQQHVLHGIENKETYIHRGCVADYWLAVSALLELYPQLSTRLFYYGASFGGGIGALALPWESRIKRAFLDAPSFGHHPLRVTLECLGSGQSVRDYYHHHPEVLQTLRYFDAAVASRLIRIPVYVAAALLDPVVPPPSQFSVYNALPNSKKLFTRQAAHVDNPLVAEETDTIHRELESWFHHE